MNKLFFIILSFLSVSSFSQDLITSIPFEKYGDHLFIKVSVDDSEPLDFIFDTGDGLTVIDLDIAMDLDLDLDQKQSTTSAGGRITGSLIKHNKIEINDLLMESNIKVYATELDHLEISIGRNVDGIVGYDLLVHHTVELNYDEMTFNVYKKGKGPTKGQEVEFKLHNAIPTVEASVVLNNGEKLSGDFFLNTGAGTTMDFNTPFANKNDIIKNTGNHYSYLVKGLESKESLHFEGKVESFAFADNSFEKLPIGISQATYGIQNDKKIAGIIGNRLLSNFNIIFDYHNNKIYLEENQSFSRSFSVNSSGIDVQLSQDKSKVLIHQVYKNSPAANADIQLNDELVSINGEDAIAKGLPAIKKIMEGEGTISLLIKRDGEEKEVSLKLKPLI